MDRWLVRREEDFAREIRDTIRSTLGDAAAELDAGLTAGIDPAIWDAVGRAWLIRATGWGEALGAMFQSAGMRTAAIATNRLLVPAAFAANWTTVVNQAAVQYAASATNRLVGLGDSIWQTFRSDVTNAIMSGRVGEELTQTIYERSVVSEFRAEVIARTETVGAYNQGNYEAAVALGPYGPVEKEWLAAQDDRTRPDHAAADGQTVAFDAMFDVGGVSMTGPHDPSAPAEQIVQCRCVLVELWPGDRRRDGSTVPEQSSA